MDPWQVKGGLPSRLPARFRSTTGVELDPQVRADPSNRHDLTAVDRIDRWSTRPGKHARRIVAAEEHGRLVQNEAIDEPRSEEGADDARTPFDHQLHDATGAEILEQAIERAVPRPARLYTGPLFVKYNAVLRGLSGPVLFLRRKMVQKCCAATDAAAYVDAEERATVSYRAERALADEKLTLKDEAAIAGKLADQVALRRMNKYTTTLHAINSGIVKLSKLTVAYGK